MKIIKIKAKHSWWAQKPGICIYLTDSSTSTFQTTTNNCKFLFKAMLEIYFVDGFRDSK